MAPGETARVTGQSPAGTTKGGCGANGEFVRTDLATAGKEAMEAADRKHVRAVSALSLIAATLSLVWVTVCLSQGWPWMALEFFVLGLGFFSRTSSTVQAIPRWRERDHKSG